MKKYAVRIINGPRPGPFDTKESIEIILEAYLAGVKEDLGVFAKLISMVPGTYANEYITTWEI